MAQKIKKRLAKKASSCKPNGAFRGITRRLDAQFTKSPRGTCNRKFRSKALALGIKVDNQLTKYAKDNSTPLCLQAKSIVKYINARGWKIVGSQVRVGDPKKKRCTAIDLLCTSAQKEYVVVEVKTRLVSVAYHTETYMQIDSTNPTTALKTPNSLYWRHMSQLRQTVEMFKLSKRARGKIVKGIVLVTLQGTCIPYPLR